MTNSEQVNETIRALGLNPSAENVPNANVVVETNPLILKGIEIIAGGSSSTSASTSTLYTCSSSRDTYLAGYALSYTKDAACDRATGTASILVTLDGQTTQVPIITISTITLTAQQFLFENTLNRLIKLKRGSTIQFSADTFTAGVRVRDLRIRAFEV